MWDEGYGRPLLMGTVKIVIAIGLLSIVAAHFLSDRPDIVANIARSDRNALLALIGAPSPVSDPSTTGSVRNATTPIKIDPCEVRANR